MTSGRLSEMFGKGQVETDAFLRTLGWRRVAQKEYDKVLSAADEEVPPGLRRGSQRLPEGQGRRGHLRRVRGPRASSNDYKPQEWTPVDSVAWLKAMAWDLRGNMQDEIDRSLMTSRLGREADRGPVPGRTRTSRNKPIVGRKAVRPGDRQSSTRRAAAAASTAVRGSGTVRNAGRRLRRPARASSPRLSETLDEIPALLGPNGNGIGSNSWVVSGDAHDDRQAAAGQRPAPGAAAAVALVPDGPALPQRLRASCQYDVAGLHLLRACPA